MRLSQIFACNRFQVGSRRGGVAGGGSHGGHEGNIPMVCYTKFTCQKKFTLALRTEGLDMGESYKRGSGMDMAYFSLKGLEGLNFSESFHKRFGLRFQKI